MATSANDRIRRTSVASVHVHYVAKVEKKGRTRAEVEEIEDPFMREVRHLDKLVDEVSKGKAMEKVLRAG